MRSANRRANPLPPLACMLDPPILGRRPSARLLRLPTPSLCPHGNGTVAPASRQAVPDCATSKPAPRNGRLVDRGRRSRYLGISFAVIFSAPHSPPTTGEARLSENPWWGQALHAPVATRVFNEYERTDRSPARGSGARSAPAQPRPGRPVSRQRPAAPPLGAHQGVGADRPWCPVGAGAPAPGRA